MDSQTILTVALCCLVAGFGFVGRYLYLDYKAKKEKSFVLISLGLLAFWFFGGSTFLIIAVLLFLLLLFRGC